MPKQEILQNNAQKNGDFLEISPLTLFILIFKVVRTINKNQESFGP